MLDSLSYKDVGDFYEAVGIWVEIISSQQVEYALQPGMVVAMDNHRIFHGRKAFDGHRRLCGCYLNMDDVRARVRELEGLKEPV